MLSMYAVFLAAIICHGQRHFTIALSQPSTWYVATRHRCGWLLIATFAWLVYETLRHARMGGLRRLYRTA
jgi:hypothetical protein